MGDAKIPGGYFLKARQIKNSFIAHAPPCVREIWDYLLREANHADKKYDGKIIKRGQLFRSYKQIRTDLRWKIGYRTQYYSESQTKHCMNALMKERMIELMKEPRGMVITILNYDYFQDPTNYERTDERTDERTNDEPMTNQQCLSINKNYKNYKKDLNNNLPQKYPVFAVDEVAEEPKPQPQEVAPSSNGRFYIGVIGKKKVTLKGDLFYGFEKFWTTFDYRKGKAEAAGAWFSLNPDNDLTEKIIKAAKVEAELRQDLLAKGKTPKWAQGWITSRRWEDETTVFKPPKPPYYEVMN